MSSLANRLAKIQEKVETPVPDIDHYTLEELATKQVDFGKTHVGKSYQHMWEHEQGWILWFTQHYAKSTNVKHRLVLKFVELKVSEAENWNHKVKVYPAENDLKQTIHTVAKAKATSAKAKSQAMPSGVTTPLEDESYPEDEFELLQAMSAVAESELKSDVQCLQQRMLNMENMLQQIVVHIQNKEPSPSPWDQ